MDLTPGFLDRWREHRDLDYIDRVHDIVADAIFDQAWLEEAQVRALAREAAATLRHSGMEVDEETAKAVIDRGETESVDADLAGALRAYGDAHRAALAAAEQQAAITPGLLDELHARLCAGAAAPDAGVDSDATLRRLCEWLAAPPDDLHPVVVATVAHVEVLRLRRWADGNARLARLLLLLLLWRAGYDYHALFSPSTEWSDPRRLPDQPAEELSPHKAETLPAVEHVVHRLAISVRDMVSWVRAEEGGGSLQGMAFGFPLQP